MNFTCKFCSNIIELDNENVNYIRGKKAGHLKSCEKFKDFKKSISKEFLLEEYIHNERSASDIAYEFGFSSSTFIIKLLKKYNIPIRKIKESNSSKHCKQKRITTNIQKYGCENVRQSPVIKEIIKNNTNYKELGNNVSKTLKSFSSEKWKEIYKKRSLSLFKKYGVYNVMQFDYLRQKMRLYAINKIQDLKNNGLPIYPAFNKDACRIINEFGQKYNYKFMHAMNGGEFFIKELGYWVDGYDKDRNVVIEIDENHHFTKEGNLSENDIRRQKEIEEFLKCKFIRLKFDDYK